MEDTNLYLDKMNTDGWNSAKQMNFLLSLPASTDQSQRSLDKHPT